MKKTLLVDFSKVLSPLGISRYLSEQLTSLLLLPKEEIRTQYKTHISYLVKGVYDIEVFLEEMRPYLKSGKNFSELEEMAKKVPPLDDVLLQKLISWKEKYHLVLISDVYKSLGEEIRKSLDGIFDTFIFSFEEKHKKSEAIFWEQLQSKIDFSSIALFIDDKEENVVLAKQFGICSYCYDPTKYLAGLNKILEKMGK